MKYIFTILMLCMFFTKCIAREYPDRSQLITLTEIKDILIDTTCFKSKKYVHLETNEHSLIRKINRICNHNNKLFILDKSLHKVLIFNMDGKYLNNIYRIGNGPAEYAGVMDFCLDTINKHLLLLCDRPYKIMKFDYSGKFLEEKRLNELFFNIIADGDYIYCNRLEINTTNEKDYELACMNFNGKIIDNQLKLRKNIKSALFPDGRFLTTTLSNLYTRRFDNAIYDVKNGNIEKKYTFDFKKHAFPEKLLKESEDVVSYLCKENKYIYYIANVAENKNYLMFKTNIGIFILNKNTNELTGYNVIRNIEIKFSSNSYYPVGYNSKIVASLIEISILNMIKDEKTDNFDNYELLKLAEKAEEDDNPVLVLYEFK